MKKFITLALVLVMALSLAVPALAYTNTLPPASGVSPLSVSIILVEYKGINQFYNWVSLPPIDRGYATNEVIAYVGSITVPKGEAVWDNYYRQLLFKGKNVTLNVADNLSRAGATNWWLQNTVPNAVTYLWANAANGYWTPDDNYATLKKNVYNTNSVAAGQNGGSFLPKAVTGQEIYSWLGFGKVTGDDATMTFTLSRNAEFRSIMASVTGGGKWNTKVTVGTGILPAGIATITGVPAITEFLVVSDKYVVLKAANNTYGGNSYYVYGNNGDLGFGQPAVYPNLYGLVNADVLNLGQLIFSIDTRSKNVSEAMRIYPNGAKGAAYRVHGEPSVNLPFFIVDRISNVEPNGWKFDDQIRYTSTMDYEPLANWYNKYVAEAFGFNVFNVTNILKDGDWHKVAAATWDLSDTVDIEPWTPYVAVPENIVTDPPKTGDASVLGFVMIVLAAAAAVVVKKVRA